MHMRGPHYNCVCNNVEIADRHFTQIDGAIIDSTESGSVTDIFGAEYVEKVATLKPSIGKGIEIKPLI